MVGKLIKDKSVNIVIFALKDLDHIFTIKSLRFSFIENIHQGIKFTGPLLFRPL